MNSHQTFNVGVKGLIVRENRILILKPTGEDLWEVPGGRMDPHEDIHVTLSRELREELPQASEVQIKGLVDAQRSSRPLSESLYLMLLFFRVSALIPRKLQLSAEHEAAHWLAPDELQEFALHAADLQALTKAFGQKFSL